MTLFTNKCDKNSNKVASLRDVEKKISRYQQYTRGSIWQTPNQAEPVSWDLDVDYTRQILHNKDGQRFGYTGSCKSLSVQEILFETLTMLKLHHSFITLLFSFF